MYTSVLWSVASMYSIYCLRKKNLYIVILEIEISYTY